MRRVWAGWFALWFALAGAFAAPAPAQTLTVERLRSEGRSWQRPDGAVATARWSSANAEAIARVELPRNSEGYWLRLSVDRDIAVRDQRVIVLQSARAYGSVGYYPPGSGRIKLIGHMREDGPKLLRRGWALPLAEGWKRGEAAYAKLSARTGSLLDVRLSTQPELLRQLESDRRFAIAAYAVMLVMTLVVAGYWVNSRESVYLYYCGYLICISLYMLMMTGWLTPPAWFGSAMQRDGIPWILATLASVFQLCFTLRFLELPRLTPRAAGALRLIVWANLLWLAVLLLAFDWVYQYWYIGGNGLLLLAIPLVIYAALVAWRRGAEYAGYYLLGWTPLLMFAGLMASKTLGLNSVDWAERGLVVAVVLESGVLLLALTQRAAARHRRAQPMRPRGTAAP